MDSALLMKAVKRGGSFEGFEFIEELSSASTITYAALCTAVGLTTGTVGAGSGWLSCKLDGKELLVAKQLPRINLHWGNLYNLGLVYGVDGPGPNPFSTPVNQLKTVVVNGSTYKVRLLKGSNSDPAPSESGFDLVSSRQSEFSRIFYPIVIGDTYITSYTGPKLAEYTQAVLNMGYRQWCQETVSPWKIVRGLTSTARTDRSQAINGSDYTQFAWRPVLEKIA